MSEEKAAPAAVQAQAGAKPTPTVSDIFGQVTWLLTQSKGHRNFFISDLEWLAMPPLLLRQFRIFPGKDQPLGVALWARLSDEAAERLAAGGIRLAPGDWNSGPNLWLVELIAPFGHQDKMLEDLRNTVFAGKSFRMHAIDKDGKRQVVTLEGAKPGDAGATADPASGNGETPTVN
ncbi:MAG: toxin-activating lysine-acyltransferase [Parvibaculaceae bacterium]